VAELAEAAARRCRIDEGGVVSLRRAALVHHLGRVAVDARIWHKRAPLSADEWYVSPETDENRTLVNDGTGLPLRGSHTHPE
jgi:response regulator RpfG family c-di-GMP phosphodiesterase